MFQSDWKGTRRWVGPEFWAAPLQDWSVENNEVVAMAAKGRLLHLLTHALTEKPGAFTLSVTVRKKVGGSVPPDEVAHRKGSGYGIVRLNKKTREVIFEMWRHGGGQFEGFPKTIKVGEKHA